MRKNIGVSVCILLCLVMIPAFTFAQGAIIADHTTIDITAIPQAAIAQAKATLHIAYGHTSHGSQITDGMTGLVGFMNGLGYPHNLYDWDESDTAGAALHLRDYYGDFPGASDLGEANSTNPGDYAWYTATRNYLNNPANSEINVMMWSWCGGVSRATEAGMNMYLSLMNQLEQDFPTVTFIYMTGHLDGTGLTGNLHIRNQQIRDYCAANNKVLFDFADIETYDPDGTYYGDKYPTDGCNYDANNNGTTEEDGDPGNPLNGDKNWALDWQGSHTEGVDWYSCGSAHSRPLNANMKAYAAWWMWARLAGWNSDSSSFLLWTK